MTTTRTEGLIRRRRSAVVAAAVVLVMLAGSCGDDSDGGDSDPAALLTEYLEVWNAEDAEAVMVFYAEDVVIEGHPSDSDGLATGRSEVLAIEEQLDGHQGSTGTMEYINVEVSGETVTFDNIFNNASGECFSSTGSVATIENGLIALIVWGDSDGALC